MICAVLFLPLMTLSVRAEEYSFSLDGTEGYSPGGDFSDVLEALPPELANELSKITPSVDVNGTLDAVREKSDISYFANRILNAVLFSLPDTVEAVIPLFSVILFMAVGKASVGTIASLTLGETYFSLMKLTGAVAVFTLTSTAISLASAYLTQICDIMNVLTPVMEALCVASGSITRGSVISASLMLIVTVIGNINTHLMAPLTSVLFTLSAVSMVCSESKLGGIADATRKLIMRIWQITSLFFSFMLGSQSIIAGGADSLGTRGIKFAIGSFVPMAGGMISEAFDTLTTGLSFVRSATGVGGIILIIIILVSGIVPIFLLRVGVWILATASGMLELHDMSAMLSEIRGIIELLEGIVLYTSLMFILALILFTKSQAV